MTLLGDWNWYLPSWLEWLPRIESDQEAAPPPREDPAGEEEEEARPVPAPA